MSQINHLCRPRIGPGKPVVTSGPGGTTGLVFTFRGFLVKFMINPRTPTYFKQRKPLAKYKERRSLSYPPQRSLPLEGCYWSFSFYFSMHLLTCIILLTELAKYDTICKVLSIKSISNPCQLSGK